MNQTNTNHPFFLTLGAGPYKYVGYGHYRRNDGVDSTYSGPECEHKEGHCSHCGTRIHHVYVVETAEGKRLGVGSDCIFKLQIQDEFQGMDEIRRHVAEMRRIQAKERREKKLAMLKIDCASLLETHKEHLSRVFYMYRMDMTAYEQFTPYMKRNFSLKGWQDIHKKILLCVSKPVKTKVEIEIERKSV